MPVILDEDKGETLYINKKLNKDQILNLFLGFREREKLIFVWYLWNLVAKLKLLHRSLSKSNGGWLMNGGDALLLLSNNNNKRHDADTNAEPSHHRHHLGDGRHTPLFPISIPIGDRLLLLRPWGLLRSNLLPSPHPSVTTNHHPSFLLLLLLLPDY